MASKQHTILPKGPVKERIEEGSSHYTRKRVGTACNECRRARRKCDGRRPSCSPCIQHSKLCQYELDGRNRDSLRNTINELENENSRLEEAIKQLRSELRFMPQVEATASSHPVTQRAEAPLGALFDTKCGKIPGETFTRNAATAFFSGIFPLFHIILPDDYDHLIHRIYQAEFGIPRCDVCELCAIAAVGCRYDSSDVPHEYMDIFWEQCLLLVYDAIDEANVRTLRVLICLGIYLILDKSMSARVIIASGIQLARWCMPKQDSRLGSKTEWDSLFQSLASLECWLSFALGYEHSLTEEDTQYITEQDIAEDSNNVSGLANDVTLAMIRSQMWKISFLSAELFKRIRLLSSSTWVEFEQVSSELDTWHQELPASMQLRSLASNNDGPSPEQRRGLLLVHMAYLENRMLFFQHFLQQNTESRLLQLTTNTRQTYAAFAHQLASIISIIYQDKWPFVRNWLVIHASFHCSITMLSIICQCYLTNEDLNDIISYRTDIERCAEVLTYCSQVDQAAARLLHTVQALSENLDQVISEPQQTPVPREELMKIGSILNTEFPGRITLFKTTEEVVNKMALKISSGSQLH